MMNIYQKIAGLPHYDRPVHQPLDKDPIWSKSMPVAPSHHTKPVSPFSSPTQLHLSQHSHRVGRETLQILPTMNSFMRVPQDRCEAVQWPSPWCGATPLRLTRPPLRQNRVGEEWGITQTYIHEKMQAQQVFSGTGKKNDLE